MCAHATGRTAVAISAGYMVTCAVLSDGNAACWGQGAYGQLGTGAATARGDQVGEMGSNLITINLGPGSEDKAFSVCGLDPRKCSL